MAYRSCIFLLALVVTASTASCGNIIIDTSGVYVAQAPAGDKNGRGCSNARALGDLTPADWVPGNTIHLCGTITFPAGSAGLVAQGSGTSSSPIIVKFETNAILEAPYFAATASCWSLSTCTAGIELYGYNYIIVDGGSNGIIENTANGTDLIYQQSSAGISIYGNNIIVRNLTVKNMYMNDPSKNDKAGQGTVDIGVVQGATNVTLCNNTLGQSRAGISSQGSGGSTPAYPLPSCSSNTFLTGHNYFGNTLSDHAWTFLLGQGSGATASTINVFNTTFNFTEMWVDADDDFHNDGIIAYGVPQVVVYVFNNVFEGTFTGTANVYCTYGVSGSGSACYVFNNLLIPTANGWGIAMGLGSPGDGHNMGPHFVYNNTIIGLGAPILWSGNNTGLTSENNLISESTASSNYFYVKSGSSGSMPNNLTTSDYNNFYGGRGLSFNATTGQWWCWPNTGGSPSGCGSSYNGPWVRTGFDTHSISANPQITASYQLSNGSPDIRAGANLSSLCATPGLGPLCYDKNGVARPLTGPWDIGAYQSEGPLPATRLSGSAK